MTGDDRVRFCGQCEKHVYNLSGMTRADAERLVRESTGEICVRLYQRTDGTVLTADCPVGVKRVRRRKVAAAALSGGLLAAGALLANEAAVDAQPVPLARTMPEVTAPTIAPEPVITAPEPGRYTAGLMMPFRNRTNGGASGKVPSKQPKAAPRTGTL
jgi:hypothetical protein